MRNKLFIVLAFVCGLIMLSGCNCANYLSDGLQISYEQDKYLLQEGTTYELEPKITNGSLGSTKLYYISQNPEVAECIDGVIYAKKAGETVITIGFATEADINTVITVIVEPTYQITYNLNGGTNHVDNPDVYYDSHCPYQLKEPTRKGYEFKGWFDNDDNQVYTIEEGTNTDLELNAKWKSFEYTITYDPTIGKIASDFKSYDALAKLYLDLFNENTDGSFTIEQIVENDKTGFSRWYQFLIFEKYDTYGETWIIEYFKSVAISEENAQLLDRFNDNRAHTVIDPLSHLNDYNAALICEFIGFISKTQHTLIFEKGSYNLEEGFTYTSANYADPDVQKKILDFIPRMTYTVEDSFNLAPAYLLNIASSDTYGKTYNFLGWYDKNGNKIEKIEKGTTGNLELEAKFAIRRYPISFELNGGTLENQPTEYGSDTVTRYNYNDSFVPTKEGYTFEGWYYDEKLQSKTGRIKIYEPVKLYAKWSLATYTITYDAKDGMVVPNFKSYDDLAKLFVEKIYDFGKIELTTETLTSGNYYLTLCYFYLCDELDNYRWIIEYFKEVSTNQDNVALLDMYNGIKNYTYGSVYKNFYLSIAFGCELISFVTKTQNTVSIEDGFLGFDAFSYTSANYADANVQKKLLEFIPKNTYTTEDETFNLVPGYQMLYNFLGWYDEDGNKVEQIEKGTTGNINLVAKYAPRQYSISFVLNGGTLEDAPTVYDVTTLSNFSYIIPTKEGYKFLNWYSDPEFTNILSRIYEYQDYVLYAKWEASDNTIS